MNSKYLLFTYFPLVDSKQLENRKFVNKYYQPFQLALEKRYKNEYSWLALIVKIDGYSLRESIKLGNRINTWGETLYFLEEWVGMKELLKIMLDYGRMTIKFLLKISTLSREFRYPEGDINLWHIFKEDWHSSFCGRTLLEGLAYYHAFRNAVAEAKSTAVMLYPAEMHAWEKALNVAAKEKGVKTVGVQHTIVPLLLLNYFNHKTELGFGDYINKVPQPDYLACVGEIPVKLFLDLGWEKTRVFSWGAIRFQHYKVALKSETPWHIRENKVIVALSISPRESKEVIRFVYQAYKGQTNYQVLLKGHPALPVAPLLASLGLKLDEGIFQIVKTPLGDLLHKSKAMIVTESSSALESIANQCPVIIPRLASTADMNPLSGVSSLPFYANDTEELKMITDKIVSGKEPPIAYKDCKEFIESYCKFPENEEEFLSSIEKLANVTD